LGGGLKGIIEGGVVMKGEGIVKTICRMCPASCGLDVSVKDGKISEVASMEEHLFKPLCPRPEGMIEWEYSKERLSSPLKRSNNQFRQISWDEAFNLICDKLNQIRQQYGAKSLVLHFGNPFIATPVEKVARRFCDLYGTPNFTSGASFCYLARTIGHSLTLDFGRVNAGPNYRGTKCAIIWGNNPEESAHLQFRTIQFYRRETKGKLIVIDPRVTTLAKQADIYAQIRPGTDCALALGLLNVIIEDKLYDIDFVDKWTVGFDKLAQHVKEYPPEKVEKITWVPEQMIREIARTYATAKPANISQGISMDHSIDGIQASRAIAILMAITGNIDIPGGNTWPGRTSLTNLRIPDRVNEEEGISQRQYPVFSQITLEQTAMCLPEAIIEGKPYPVKALIVQGSNPLLIWPNTGKAMQALKKLEFLVVIDLFMSETAKMADIVLPCTSFLERKVLKDYRSGGGLPLLVFGEKVVEPIGDCMDDWKIWVELGRRMGYRKYFLWEDAEQLFEYLLEPSGVTLDQLKEKPGGVLTVLWEKQRYLKQGKFNTPSGKVEIYSETLANYGYDPLPVYTEPPESPISTPGLAREYPLILITGARTRFFTHSQHRNVSTLLGKIKEPLAEVSTQTAERLGIADGDLVAIESPRGSIRMRAKVTGDISENVVSIQHGWIEANANILTDDEARDPISAYPPFRTGLCRVKKV
jgi:anaerobic selenocysteine-containing dehydrogenase